MIITRRQLRSLIEMYIKESTSKCDAKTIKDKIKTIKKTHGIKTGWSFSKHPLNKSDSDIKAGMTAGRDFESSHGHGGIDYWWDDIDGSPIYAIDNGEVVTIWGTPEKPHHLNGWGVDIVHAQEDCINHSSQYIHMKKFPSVGKGPVKRGQVIGYVGSTGESSGAHLHFQVKQGRGAPGAGDDGAGIHVDPDKFFAKAGKWTGGEIDPDPDKNSKWRGGEISEIIMKITRKQLKRIIRENLLHEAPSKGKQIKDIEWFINMLLIGKGAGSKKIGSVDSKWDDVETDNAFYDVMYLYKDEIKRLAKKPGAFDEAEEKNNRLNISGMEFAKAMGRATEGRTGVEAVHQNMMILFSQVTGTPGETRDKMLAGMSEEEKKFWGVEVLCDEDGNPPEGEDGCAHRATWDPQPAEEETGADDDGDADLESS